MRTQNIHQVHPCLGQRHRLFAHLFIAEILIGEGHKVEGFRQFPVPFRKGRSGGDQAGLDDARLDSCGPVIDILAGGINTVNDIREVEVVVNKWEPAVDFHKQDVVAGDRQIGGQIQRHCRITGTMLGTDKGNDLPVFLRGLHDRLESGE